MSEVQNQQQDGQEQSQDAAGQATDQAGQAVEGVQDVVGGLTGDQEQGGEGGLGGVIGQTQGAAGQVTNQAQDVAGQPRVRSARWLTRPRTPWAASPAYCSVANSTASNRAPYTRVSRKWTTIPTATATRRRS